MLWNVENTDDSIVITIGNDRPLTELSICLKGAFEWFLGSGVWMWEVGRYKMPDHAKFVVRAMVPVRPLQCSSVTQVGGLIECGLFPVNIPSSKLWEINDDKAGEAAADGAHRVYRSDEGTLVRINDLRPEIPMGVLAFGLCDQAVGYFTKGARIVRWQGSRRVAQMFFSKGMSEGDLAKFALEQASDAPDYAAEMKVGQLI